MIINRLFSLCCFLLCVLSCSQNKPVEIARYENGVAYDDQGLKVVCLYGSWDEMGRQWGALGREAMTDVWGFLEEKVEEGGKRKDFAMRADSVYQQYPDYLKTFFDAASVTSGLSIEQLKQLNFLEWGESSFQCSAISCWDDYSDGGKLIYGRNYDAASYRTLGDELVLMVYHPDGGQSFATLNYAGEIYCVNGFNESGLFVELNNGMPTTGFIPDFSVKVSTTELMRFIANARNIDEADQFFESTPSTAGFLIGVADGKGARCYEWYADQYQRSDDQTPDGLMVMTNHFVDPDWEFEIPSDENSWMSLTRRANFLSFVESRDGKVCVDDLKELLPTPIVDGGLVIPGYDMYQIIVVPEDNLFYINIPDRDVKWSEINLDYYYSKR